MNNYATGIVGARGYTGLELARLLLVHPYARLIATYASDPASFKLSNYLPEAKAAQVPTYSMQDLMVNAQKLHTVFLATPAEVSLELAPKLIAQGINVIDLSGAYRLDVQDFPKWYGFEHTSSELLKNENYGLIPFCGPLSLLKTARSQSAQLQNLKSAHLISNPGCYVTSILMALIPLLQRNLIQLESLVIDSKSGTTGAGRKASESQLFSEVEGECLPYKIAAHQHFPEICKYAQVFAGKSIDPHFSTSLINVRRGIISNIFAKLNPNVSEAMIADAYNNTYSNYPLVKHASIAAAGPYALSLKQVVGSARTHIRYKVDGQKLYLFSLIDNLMKGAASQAIENFNRLTDQAVECGLTAQEGIL